jgi:glycosyltransferase involved in cell wall biosynthesis
MSFAGELVSIGLPVRNGERTIESVVRSVLTQDHGRLELVISDNASTDRTEEVCRDLAARDWRILYHRQPLNIGLLNNFTATIQLASGSFFRWIGDDDWLAPNYVSRCLAEFDAHSELVLVTTRIQYIKPDGSDYLSHYQGTALSSPSALDRFVELMRLSEGLPLDPLYAMVRRSTVVAISRRNMIREDEVFAVKLALTGPWGHVPEVLARRHSKNARMTSIARTLGVPEWQAYLATTLQCWEVLRLLRHSNLTRSHRWIARAALAQMYLRRQGRTWKWRLGKLSQVKMSRQTRRHTI